MPLEASVAAPVSGYEERSDRLGRFEKGAPAGSRSGMAHGERHGEISENRRRQTAALKHSIETIVAGKQQSSWGLVAPEHLAKEIVEALSATCSSTLIRHEKGDWTKEPVASIEKRILGKTP